MSFLTCVWCDANEDFHDIKKKITTWNPTKPFREQGFEMNSFTELLKISPQRTSIDNPFCSWNSQHNSASAH